MSTTQEHILIADIKDDIVTLKEGGGALILSVSAVNFGLLSEREQTAIISSFAQMLNSLSFSIQIVIHSERLNITSYLSLLDKAQKIQSNPLLSKMIVQYRQFIQTTIKENDVLDKKFYVVIPLFQLELGLLSSSETLQNKIKTVLLPRKDQVVRQLQRVGLKAIQLSGQKLLELFFDIYNGQSVENLPTQPIKPEELMVSLKSPQEIKLKATPATPTIQQLVNNPPIITQPSRSHPFVTEELEDV
mgnify:CR=1 FL=1